MTAEHHVYFERLVQQINSAAKIPFRQVHLDKWQPQLNNCHRNVDFWVAQNTASKTVRGWLFWPPNECGQYMFMAHSVVEQAGELFDITPIDENTPRETLLFIRHPGTEAEFNEMKTVCSQVFYPPIMLGNQQSANSEAFDSDEEW